ncbi:MAG: hypothetical protein DLM54_00630, partial [Acidimicrobiales bacterium]
MAAPNPLADNPLAASPLAPNPLAEGLDSQRRGPPLALIIFGASGDLTARKILPALARLATRRALSPALAVVGVARTQMSDDDFRKLAADAVPDVLVMTATPIPRTAAMTVYGDLDTTVLAELPPGRTPVTTVWARGPLEETAAWDRVRAAVSRSQQAYVVCPLVEDSERVQARSATEEFERLGAAELSGLRLG